MTENQVKEINKRIKSKDGKIFWYPNRGWTSELMTRLYKKGVIKKICNHHGLITIHFADDNHTKIGPFLGHVNALAGLAKFVEQFS